MFWFQQREKFVYGKREVNRIYEIFQYKEKRKLNYFNFVDSV